MERREFLQASAGLGVGLAAGGLVRPDTARGADSTEAAGDVLARREVTRLGRSLSIVGFGGITVRDQDSRSARALAVEAMEAGVNWVDSSPAYGNSEPKIGQAFQPDREKIFLACKTKKRTYDQARREFEGSLKSLRTDRIDLYQLHCLADVKGDVDVAFGKGGAMELVDEAKKAGKIRYVGFSAHSVEAALAAMDRYDFDTCMFPVNFGCWYEGNFGPQVVARAAERNLAIFALKTLCKQRWQRSGWHRERRRYGLWYEPVSDKPDDELVMRWTLSRPITAMIPPGHPDLLRRAIQIGRSFAPLSDEQTRRVEAMAGKVQPMFRYKGGKGDNAQAALWQVRCPDSATG
jgi:aryl-alcohol dehydrogenase-like predicted oxidoreductase